MDDPQSQSWPLQPQDEVNADVSLSSKKFHQGVDYHDYLKQIHHVRKPANYLEIGVESGATLVLALCRTLAIDPRFQIRSDPVGRRAETFFQMTSDDFFVQHDPRKFLPDGIDFAFLDGMHHFEYLLRDFMNTEKYSSRDAVVTLHDCCPVSIEIANRAPNFDRRVDSSTSMWWTGDVWKLLPILRDFRPDLDVTILDCAPTGLVIVQGLDPSSETLANAYDEIVAKYQDVTLENYGIERFRAEFPASDSRLVFEPDALKSFMARRA